MFSEFIKSLFSFSLQKTPTKLSSPFSQTYRQNYNKLWINAIKNYTP